MTFAVWLQNFKNGKLCKLNYTITSFRNITQVEIFPVTFFFAFNERSRMSRLKLKILLAAPRGFCAGVDRAIQIVEKCIEKHGIPVYVRHEIVHNQFVVRTLEAKGAIFVEELDQVPGGFPVIFSAHGVPKSVPEEARRRELYYVDATCPLVSKVHIGAERHYKAGRHIILIGHSGHPEVIGTVGQLPKGAITLIETPEDALIYSPPAEKEIAYITQTTLSVDDTQTIVDILKKRIPDLIEPAKQDICYATTNRQQAVKAIAPDCDALIVIGAPNSSNSRRLVEVAQLNGVKKRDLSATPMRLTGTGFKPPRHLGLPRALLLLRYSLKK